jgi:thiol-disulfide isomerase/thioredoxin
MTARFVHMPEFASGDWLNIEHPLTKDDLRGRVVLVDFWDYTCINCIRSLPYVISWHDRYADLGLTVIGVHAPEFAFARTRQVVEAAIRQYQIKYPVLLDNDYQTWDRFANRAWPTHYVVDAEGYIRHKRQGEGHYQETEYAIQEALRQRDPSVTLPEVLPPLRPEDAPGAVCYRATPELYAGYQRGALGNREGYVANSPIVYQMPPSFERREGSFYAGGIWRSGPEYMAFAGRDGGQIALPYRAAGVNAVLSPSADLVEVLLNLRRDDAPPLVEIQLDGAPLPPLTAGADVIYDAQGRSLVYVDRPRLYELVRSPSFEKHELTLTFHATGLALYSFTFTSCVQSPG